MSVADYLTQIKEIQENLIEFIDSEEDSDSKFSSLTELFNDYKINDDKHELQILFYLLIKIANNHYRSKNFFQKINQIILLFKEDIKKYFTITEIFSIFQSNLRMTLFLIEDQIITVDKSISEKLRYLKYSGKYFQPEYKPFEEKEDPNVITFDLEDLLELISIKLPFDDFSQPIKHKKKEEESPEIFDKKRKIGENDEYICELIRNDDLDEFITYINRTNYPIQDSTIPTSDFDTNNFFHNHYDTSLIEYTAFFGSIKIFKYLCINNVKLTSSLWLYAIHGRNNEIIQYLEENNVEPRDKTFIECLKEAIKCHHNEIANYIIENHLKNDYNFKNDCFKYYNFDFIQEDDINQSFLYYLCRYNYYWLTDYLLSNEDIDVNMKIILTLLFLYNLDTIFNRISKIININKIRNEIFK